MTDAHWPTPVFYIYFCFEKENTIFIWTSDHSNDLTESSVETIAGCSSGPRWTTTSNIYYVQTLTPTEGHSGKATVAGQTPTGDQNPATHRMWRHHKGQQTYSRLRQFLPAVNKCDTLHFHQPGDTAGVTWSIFHQSGDSCFHNDSFCQTPAADCALINNNTNDNQNIIFAEKQNKTEWPATHSAHHITQMACVCVYDPRSLLN